MRPNAKRRARLYLEQFAGPIDGYDHAAAIRAMPCCATGILGPSEPHHVKSRGAGGKWTDLVPLSFVAHNLVHAMGRESFEREFNVDLVAIAAGLIPEDYDD